MADTKVQGGEYLLLIDTAGGTSYDTVVCATSVSSATSIGVVDASSACGADKSPGTVEISYSFEGQTLISPTGSKVSIDGLLQACRNKTTVGFKFGRVTPISGDVTQTGTGYISEFNENYPYDNVGTFTLTLQPYGTPTITVTP